jgi:hypothetical protein
MRGSRTEPLDWKTESRLATSAIVAAHLSGAIFTFVYLTFIAPSEPTRPGSSASHGDLVRAGLPSSLSMDDR